MNFIKNWIRTEVARIFAAERAKFLADIEATKTELKNNEVTAVLERVATATEYVASAEKHDRQARLAKHDF